MNCPNGHEVNGQVKFCPICGADMRGTKYCTNWGYERNGDEKFCPHCGTPFNIQKTFDFEKDDNKAESNKSLLIFLSIVTIIIIGVGCLLYFSKGDSKDAVSTANNEAESIQVVDSIETVASIDNSTEYADSIAESSESYYSESSSSDYESSSSNSDYYDTSSSRKFLNEQYVVGYLANQTFTNYSNIDIRFDGDGRIYIDGDYAGVVSVLRYNETSAMLRYGGGMYDEGKIGVRIEDGRLQLRDPIDGTVWYQK